MPTVFLKTDHDFFVHFRFKPLILALSASPATAVKADQIKVELDKLLNDLDCRVIVPRPQDLRPFWNRPQVSYLLKELNDYQKYVRVESFELRVHESWKSCDVGQLFPMLSQHYHVFYLSKNIVGTLIKLLFC
jgi:hypothetical protein